MRHIRKTAQDRCKRLCFCRARLKRPSFAPSRERSKPGVVFCQSGDNDRAGARNSRSGELQPPALSRDGRSASPPPRWSTARPGVARAAAARSATGVFGPRTTRRHFSIQALRHHSALAWLQLPSSRITPSMLRRIARWFGSTSPLRPTATMSASGASSRAFSGAEIKDRPALRIDGSPEYLREARPRQADLQRRALEMQRGQARGAEHAVLLLRMLQDQEFDGVVFGQRYRRRRTALPACRSADNPARAPSSRHCW